ncbi:unnamed protein product, partial [Cyprideis torosa]
MQIDIKTTSVEPIRQTFGHVARRIGPGKTASRYQEATFDLQPTTNFHYRPLWDPEHQLYDKERTVIKMEDWYDIKDPRQYYYGTWTINRSKQQDAADRNFKFVEGRGLLNHIDTEWQQKIKHVLLPLRHLEYAANQNNCYCSAYGWGTAVTQATMYSAIDRLGIAQYVSRVGLVLDDNSAESLDEARELWMSHKSWQPIRKLAEDMMMTKDWFELFVAQNVVLDGLLYPLIYQRFDSEVSKHGGSAFAMLTEFQNEWFGEVSRFVDAVIKTCAAESEGNANQIRGWVNDWRAGVEQSLMPLMEDAFGDRAAEQMAWAQAQLSERLSKKCK